MRKLVIIPTYNERENIAAMVAKVFSLEGYFHLLVIDDGSPDGTAEIVRTLQRTYPERLFLIERSGKLGLGTAYIAGFKWALAHDYDAVFEMDCDFSHNPNDLLRLTEAMEEGADIAVGSRYVTGVNVVNWPLSRLLISYFASKYVRLITRMPVNDATAGFVGYRPRPMPPLPTTACTGNPDFIPRSITATAFWWWTTPRTAGRSSVTRPSTI